MATGVPKKGRSSDNSNKPILFYDGKMDEGEILATKPAEILSLGHRPMSHHNTLYYGDNIGILAALLNDPLVKGQVRLVYIDPPFSTQSSFYSRKQRHAYEDILVGSDYVEFLRRRIVLLRELLADDGSFYLHLDEKMVFHMKIILDEIFGSGNYRSCITRKKCNPKNYTRKTYGNIADYILFYTKSAEYVWNKPLERWTEERAKEYQYIEPEAGRRYMKVPLHAPGVRKGETGKPWRGMSPPPGKHWQYLPSKLDEMDARGEIYWSPSGNPRRKVYLDQSPGVRVQDIWLDFRDAHNQNIRITGYPTEKNPDLLRRIIETSSRAGDLVLDCFCGSGTTMAVAHDLGRSWIGIDNSIEAIRTTLKRFLKGTERMGDYVKAGEKAEPKHHQPSLFDSLEKEVTPESQWKQTPISDFEILAAQENADEISEILIEWKEKTSERPAESPR